MKDTIQDRVDRLEKKFQLGKTPGTIISRCLLDGPTGARILKEHGLPDRRDQNDIYERKAPILLWSVAIGPIGETKFFSYGYTIEEALDKVEQGLEKLIQQSKELMERVKKSHKPRRRK